VSGTSPSRYNGQPATVIVFAFCIVRTTTSVDLGLPEGVSTIARTVWVAGRVVGATIAPQVLVCPAILILPASRGAPTESVLGVMEAARGDEQAVRFSVHHLYEPVLVVDASGREAGQVAPEPFRFADAAFVPRA
jgi:hypothetical protein